MNKSELLVWLREEYGKWEAFLDQIDPAHMEKPGVVAHWSMKDLIAHLTGWHRKLVAQIRAAHREEPQPPPPWPAHLQHEDEINAWLYDTNRGLSLSEAREESTQVFQQLFAVIEDLPDDVRIETFQPSPDRAYYLVWLGEERFPAGEFFDHYYDDHEPDVRAWLGRIQN